MPVEDDPLGPALGFLPSVWRLNTMVPAFVRRGPAPEFDTPEVPWPTVNETPPPEPRTAE